MARKRYGKAIGKMVAAVVLALVAFVGLQYGSMLNEMDQGAADYSRGDPESSLKRYENVEAKLRSFGALRIIPSRDRQNLFLNQARLLYGMKRYQDAAERLEKEDEITGQANDGRFYLLRGEIGFRKAVMDYQQSTKKDANLLEENLLGAQDSLQESLRLTPADWDAKYNFEYINYIRKMLTAEGTGKVKLLMEEENKPKQKELPPELAG